MKSSTDYNPTNSFALLLIGPPKTGKTNLCMQFPSPYFFDADDNLWSAIRRFPGKEFYYDTMNKDDKGPVLEKDQWERAISCLNIALKDPKVGAIVIDSATTLCNALINFILSKGSKITIAGEKSMEMSHWTPYKMLMTRLILGCRSAGKPFIMTCHEVVDKDEVSGVLNYRPSIQGQLRDTIGALFTDVWSTEVKDVIDPLTKQTKQQYYVRTSPTGRKALGNSLGLPSEFVFTWEEFQKYLGK